MSAEQQLHEAYKEWRRLSETEGEAIRTRNWLLVADCQKALQQLQPLIFRHTGAAQEEWTRLGLDRAARENQLRTLVTELIEIESRNRELLQRMQQEAQAQVGQLERASHTLRQVQRFYAPPASQPAAWTSFS
jgi:hypothetical protein